MRRVSIGLALLGLLAVAAEATTIRRLTLEQVVGHASEVFVGTVVSTRSLADGPPRNLIHTEVTFGSLRHLKGAANGETVSYRFAGGTLGDRRLEVVGVPRFTVGRRVVLLANPSLDRLCPAVGWWQGRYVVGAEPGTRREIVLDSGERPVYRFVDGRPVTKPRDGEDRPMALSDFLDRLRAVVREQEAATGEENEEEPPASGGAEEDDR
jgi:hypothetical protein